MNSNSLPLVLGCSPRPGGNSDAALALFTQGLAAAPESLAVRQLRDHQVLPCVACGSCARRPGSACPFEQRDTSTVLLHALNTAPALCLVSPMYFYHLPAQLKALVDRTQPFWEAWRHGMTTGPGFKRTAWVILLAARPKGQRLFEGSLLTLRYCFDALGIDMAEPLCLYGVDAPGDLAADPQCRAAVAAYAQNARPVFFGTPKQG